MALYVLDTFECYRREVAFPHLLLPSDYENLCPGFVLAVAKEYTRDYDLPETPQMVRLMMFLNEAMKLGMLRRWMIGIMESTLKELWWSTFQAWSSGDRVSVRLLHHGLSSLRDTEKMAGHVRDTFKWHLRRASRPLRDLHLSFTLSDTEEAVRDFNILEIVQATFYAVVVIAVELSVVSRDKVGDLKSTLKGLQWTNFESWLSISKRALLKAQLRQQTPPGGGLGQLIMLEQPSFAAGGNTFALLSRFLRTIVASAPTLTSTSSRHLDETSIFLS
ncbi:hypothetical protein Cgig2_016465 [Carnegiea gigantea]|uniref:Uncharacterized protein n=1 Tax=Carnegiea gigantea TaxID=171969 RepID=A0A9Q1GR07_9CARY|nr:hypothetical protein Cgig2_016465 [Carnegiea gigantea]